MGKKTKLREELEIFAEEISSDYHLNKMYLFGSRASGKVKKNSDVDLLLVSKTFKGKRRLQRSPPLYLKWNLQYPVDFVCLTPEEFNHKKKIVGIVREAVEKGIQII